MKSVFVWTGGGDDSFWPNRDNWHRLEIDGTGIAAGAPADQEPTPCDIVIFHSVPPDKAIPSRRDGSH